MKRRIVDNFLKLMDLLKIVHKIFDFDRPNYQTASLGILKKKY